MSWNIDGLDERNILERTRTVCSVINSKKPDVVFLQEVVPQTLPIFQSKCPGLVDILKYTILIWLTRKVKMVWHLKQYLRRKLWSRVWRGVVGRENAGWSIVWATFRNEIAYHLGKWEISTDSDYHCSSNFYCSGLTLSHLKVIKTLFSPSNMKTLLSWHVRRITTPNSQNNMKKIIPLIDLLVLFRIKWLQME